MEASPGRLAALEVLRAVRRGDLADRAMARAARGLEPRDHAWVLELTNGVFRLRSRLDAILASAVRAGLDSLDPDVLDVLRLGTYQLLEMDGVPAYAAVSQSVELVRAAGHSRASGLVNGVLQAIRRNGVSEAAFPDPDGDPIGHLTTAGAHPRWLVERWVERFGLEEARELVARNNLRPDLYVRPLTMDPAEAAERLGAAGIAAEPVPFAPDSLRLVAPARPAEALAAIPAVVQDPAAALVVRYAAFDAGSTVLDLCAAPGGKTLGVAASASYVVAADLSWGRLQRVRDNVERTGFGDRVGLVVADGRHPPFRAADGVLLDAPCSGTGTFRRHPDGKWRLVERNIEPLVRLQRELLDGAAALVRPGGVLVYSTCSLEAEENEMQVDRFLGQFPEFRRDPADAGLDASLLDTRGDLRVLPQHHHVDGAYAARLRRNA